MTDREIVIALAEKVMGWKSSRVVFHDQTTSDVLEFRDENGRIKPLMVFSDGLIRHWNPLKSISDAWMLVEALRKRFRRIEVMAASDKVDGMAAYCCQIEDGTSEVDEGYIAISDADSAPRAICLAALRAVSVEVTK